MRLIFLWLLLCSASLLTAQEASELTVDLCDCLTRADRQTARNYAADCLRRAAAEHRRYLRRTFNLDHSREMDRLAFVERNYDELVTYCPLLLTLRPVGDPKFSWSDIDESGRVDTPLYGDGRKEAGPISVQPVPGERPGELIIEGRLADLPHQGTLVLQTGKSRQLYLELSPELRRYREWMIGRVYRIRCRERWSPAGIALEARSLE